MLTSRIVGTGMAAPERVVDNHEIGSALGASPEHIHRLTGITSRRWVSGHESASDLAVGASQMALETAGCHPSALDAVIVSTTSPDTVFPSTACYVQRALGARCVAAFDVAASCSGFLYGLSVGDVLIRSGQAKTCLVVAAEVKSVFLDKQDAVTAVLFADGAGAAVLVADETTHLPRRGILGIRLYADGAHHRLIRLPAGGSRQPSSSDTVRERRHAIQLEGTPVFRLAVRRLAAAVQELLEEFGLTVPDVRRAVFHQANGRILEALGRRLGLSPDQTTSIIERYGNTSSASLPMALDCTVRGGGVSPGDPLLLGAFGGGLTWATALIRW
ncbi:MAG: 3-oxoacyl-ACP synthase III family protein [Nitrospiraceae bacterium]